MAIFADSDGMPVRRGLRRRDDDVEQIRSDVIDGQAVDFESTFCDSNTVDFDNQGYPSEVGAPPDSWGFCP